MELLMKSSQNLKLLIETVKIHEQTVSTWVKNNYTDISLNEMMDMDVPVNDYKPPDVSINQYKPQGHDPELFLKSNSFAERTYSNIFKPENTYCLLSKTTFSPQDRVFLVKECNHLFSKDHFLHWIKYHNHCPSCKHVLL